MPIEAVGEQGKGIFGDWYVNITILQRQHFLLLVSEKTLLPVLMSAKNITSFPLQFPAALTAILTAIKIPDEKIRTETQTLNQWRFAKTASRQVLGSMNDFVNMFEADTEDGRPLVHQALRLGISPCSPIGMNNPLDVTATAFGEKLSINFFDL